MVVETGETADETILVFLKLIIIWWRLALCPVPIRSRRSILSRKNDNIHFDIHIKISRSTSAPGKS
jgi:hypothetical protein